MKELPEKKNPTEALDVQRRIEETIAGTRPIDDNYPYFAPDYAVHTLHIGKEKQLFLDNFVLDHFQTFILMWRRVTICLEWLRVWKV